MEYTNVMIHGIDGWGCKRARAAVETSSITPAWAKAVYRQQRATIAGLKAMEFPGEEVPDPGDAGPREESTAYPATVPMSTKAPRDPSKLAVAQGRDHRAKALDDLIAEEVDRAAKQPTGPSELPYRPTSNEGVSRISKTGWRGRIRLGGKDVFSQTFKSRDEAIVAVRAKRVELGLVAGEDSTT